MSERARPTWQRTRRGPELDPAEVHDVVIGGSLGEGTTGANIARQVAVRAGLPVSTSGVTINRFCSTGLQTIAFAAQRVMTGEVDALVAGGLESIADGGTLPS